MVSHVEYAPGALLRLENRQDRHTKGRTDGRTPDGYITRPAQWMGRDGTSPIQKERRWIQQIGVIKENDLPRDRSWKCCAARSRGRWCEDEWRRVGARRARATPARRRRRWSTCADWRGRRQDWAAVSRPAAGQRSGRRSSARSTIPRRLSTPPSVRSNPVIASRILGPTWRRRSYTTGKS